VAIQDHPGKRGYSNAYGGDGRPGDARLLAAIQVGVRWQTTRPASENYTEGVNLTIALDREVDGRWIADIPELNILVYGNTRDAAIEAAERAAREIIADRIAHGTLPAHAADPCFAVAA
jgi:predicted RNase H-like HicB family nuclease